MANLNQFLDLINQLRTSAENVHKDIDHQDAREETKGDLKQLTSGFQQLQQFLSNVNGEDMQDLQREMQEWISGKQDFQQYAKDVTALISAIRNRSQNDEAVQQKIQENLPEKHKERNLGDFFNEIKGVIEQISNFSKAGK